MNTMEDETKSRKNNLIDHLKDPDFFDVAKFPVSSFTFTKTTVTGKENIWVTGNLTIKGISTRLRFRQNFR